MEQIGYILVLVRNILAKFAAEGRHIFYQDLCRIAGLPLNMSHPIDRERIGGILGAISTVEHQSGRPLLSSIVLNKPYYDEGDGFYRLAERLGYGKFRELKKDKVFMSQMMNETFKFWKSEEGQNLLKKWNEDARQINM